LPGFDRRLVVFAQAFLELLLHLGA
jgi:hypothetical protein